MLSNIERAPKIHLAGLVSALAWAVLACISVYFAVVVLLPFYRDGIFLLSDRQIAYSDSVIVTEQENYAFTYWILSVPLLIVLLARFVFYWRNYSQSARWMRLAILFTAATTTVLTLISLGTLVSWLID